MKSPRKTQFSGSGVSRAVLALLAFGVAGLLAQDPPPAPVPKVNPPPAPQAPAAQAPERTPPRTTAPSDSQGTLRVNVNLVILPVTVKDGNGRLVPDLTRAEFRILDDNIEQRIDFFSAEAFPLSVVVLLDNDLKSKDSEQVESSLSAIAAGLSSNDEAFVCRFDTNFHPGKGFTHDQDQLLTELRRTRIDDSRNSAPPP